MPTSEFGQPIGAALPYWSARPHPPRTSISGRFCRVEPLDPAAHGDDLYECIGAPVNHDGRWTYLPYGPFENRDSFQPWLEKTAASDDPLFFAIVDERRRAVGIAAYMRIDRANGVIEVGHLNFSRHLQRTAAATEAMYLMMRRAFDELGYRRYEWKCDSLNAPSRRAAARLGFIYEGCSGRRSCTSNAAATPRGIPSSTPSGPRAGPHSRPGSRRTISTRQAHSASHCRRSCRRMLKSIGRV